MSDDGMDEDLFEALVLLKEDRDHAEERYRAAQQKLVDHLERQRRKSVMVNNKKFTVVIAERTVIDEDGLKKDIGAVAWKRFTIPKLDRRLLERAIADGSLDPVVVAKHSVVKQIEAHIRITDVPE
jgi:hypothetical protein